jgi:hydroxymethylbilane synthase
MNHNESAICTHIERQFLKELEGGCTAPIGALATVFGNEIRFEGVLCSIDGQEKIHIEKKTDIGSGREVFGKLCAQEILANGGAEVMSTIKRDLDK